MQIFSNNLSHHVSNEIFSMRLVFLCKYINYTIDKTSGTDNGHTAYTNIIDITNYTAIIIIKTIIIITILTIIIFSYYLLMAINIY